jgi:transcriptional regulator with XRE-family HTH domain
MTATAMPGPSLTLGGFLRDRRGRLTPEPDTHSRRRMPGLRREKVAARAGVSVTWYAWLEQAVAANGGDYGARTANVASLTVV